MSRRAVLREVRKEQFLDQLLLGGNRREEDPHLPPSDRVEATVTPDEGEKATTVREQSAK